MSQKEEDRYRGETADLAAEQQELKEEMTLDEQIEGIYALVTQSLALKMQEMFIAKKDLSHFRPTILVHGNRFHAAEYVARELKIQALQSHLIPENEVWVADRKDIPDLIESRSEVKRARNKLILPTNFVKTKIEVVKDEKK